MKNIALFVVTVAGYFGLWWYFGGAPEGIVEYALRLGLLAFLSAPWDVGGNIWTVLGNAESEKSVYSLFSLYQKAGNDAFVVVGVSLYQKAGNDAAVFIGVSLYQKAGNDAAVFIGVSLYQKAERSASATCGFAIYQTIKSPDKSGLTISRTFATLQKIP